MLEEMDHHPEFPLEMYIPLYYDSFKMHHGWDYADLLSQTIHEGQTHSREHEIFWPGHHDFNDIEENISFGGLSSMASKFGGMASKMAPTMGKIGSSMGKIGSSMGSAMSSMGKFMPSA